MSLITDFKFASVAGPGQGPGHHRRPDARARHRRQRRDLQRRPRRAAAAARQPRRGPADLHPPERARHRRRERRRSRCPEIQDLRGARQDADARSATSRPSASRWSASASRASSAPASSAARTSRSWGCVRCSAGCSTPRDDGPNAAGAAVLTYRFWTTALKSDPSVHRQDRPARRRARRRSSACSSRRCRIRPRPRSSPTSSPARIICRRRWWTGRVHRMTELFGRLAPGADLEAARAELRAVHARDGQGASARRIRRRPTSASTRCGCAIRSRRRRGRCCWCCSRRRRWSSSSPARTSPT